jgi:hypothetical protein
MANASQGARTAAALTAGMVAGLIVGFGLGYYSAQPGAPAPPGETSRVHEYVGEAKHVNFAGVDPFDVYYPEPYARPPELEILTGEMRRGFDFTLVEQRADGFRIKIGSSANRADNPNGSPWLRYRARGELAGNGQQQ